MNVNTNQKLDYMTVFCVSLSIMGLFEKREHIEKVLANIEAVIEGRASHDVQSYAIAGQPIGKTPIADLLLLQDRYTTKLIALKRAERRANGVGEGRNIKVKFV